MPIEVPDLPSTSRATMYRTANASEVLDRLYEEVLQGIATGLCSALDIILGLWSLRFLVWLRSGAGSLRCLALAR